MGPVSPTHVLFLLSILKHVSEAILMSQNGYSYYSFHCHFCNILIRSYWYWKIDVHLKYENVPMTLVCHNDISNMYSLLGLATWDSIHFLMKYFQNFLKVPCQIHIILTSNWCHRITNSGFPKQSFWWCHIDDWWFRFSSYNKGHSIRITDQDATGFLCSGFLVLASWTYQEATVAFFSHWI